MVKTMDATHLFADKFGPIDNIRPSSWYAQLMLVGIVLVVALSVFLLDSTDVPHIRNLPSVRGVPILGNLAQLGGDQPRVLAKMSKKYGPVFQIRLGNKVFFSHE